MRALRLIVGLLLAVLSVAALLSRADAVQRSAPGWWDPDGVSVGSDWHYRVAVTLPAASSINSTAKVDIDFAALMVQLGISGTFDVNSVRVVRPGGAIAAVQEYNDTIYAGATDSSTTRGEVRWMVEDGGTQTYYVYFDITENGAKSANPQTPINGNFEHAATGTALPSGWGSAVKSNAAYDMQVRPSETVSVTSDGSPLNNPYSTDGTAKTGGFSYLLGARTSNEPTAGGMQTNATVLTRTITVPATNPGNLTLNWRAEGWDTENYDNLFVTITNGGVTTTLVGSALNSYATYPDSPNVGGGQAGLFASGFGQYNGYDMTTSGFHQAGMSVALHAERWWSRTYALSAFSGQTVTLTIGTNHTEKYRSWFHIDDIEWSVVTGTVGSPQGFGVAVTAPMGSLAPGQTVRVTASLDAKPTGAGNPVLADVYLPGGTPYALGFPLYNDGLHGDGAANDAIWASDASTLPLNTPSSSGWLVRIYARDASTSTQGASFNGLVHLNAQPTGLVMANWWNIDELVFSIDAAIIGVTKTLAVVSDGVNASNPKAIPGAVLRYCVVIGNTGAATAGTVVATDTLPSTLSYVAGSMLSGSDCASAATVEDDDTSGSDEGDPVGASWSGGTVIVVRASLPTANSFAVTYRAVVN